MDESEWSWVPPVLTDSIDQDVIWFRLFIQILIHMNDTDTAKNDLLRFWRKLYDGNSAELTMADQFDKEFQPSHAIRWYTRDCAIYKLIGRASYCTHYNSLYALRFIIKFIYLQLQDEHQRSSSWFSRSTITVYREQRLRHEELELFKTRIGSFYSNKTLFSSSKILENTIQFAKYARTDDSKVPVVFKTLIKSDKQITLPYADLSKLSCYPDEAEVLFMFGTIFQVDEVRYHEHEQVWLISLSLCGEDDPRLKDLVDYIKHEIKDKADLVTLADFFIKMGECDMAKEYYRKYESQLLINDSNMKRVWQGLSSIADIEGNYHISMNDYTKAHESFNEQLALCQNLPKHHPQYGKCYANIANLYELRGEKSFALENYQKAYKIYIQSLPAYHPDTTKVEQSIENLSPRKSYEVLINSPN
ncbi:unnamed protein product [Didymodactylos carnosus]|uniref:Uncharacterized protein n=1 Tax=Didymodactylos carnosus TaxID=1234261 RepID=A0A8S2FK28_9BILA|nr:unnamed protein product [Didymodactylos carnosus]CAF4280728.1 unnamed protein product [Didymodactylos carnosus]